MFLLRNNNSNLNLSLKVSPCYLLVDSEFLSQVEYEDLLPLALCYHCAMDPPAGQVTLQGKKNC